MENELRDKERAIEEMSFTDFRDAAVIENAGVKEFTVMLNGGYAGAKSKKISKETGLERAEFAGTEHDTEIAEAEQSGISKERLHRRRLESIGDRSEERRVGK